MLDILFVVFLFLPFLLLLFLFLSSAHPFCVQGDDVLVETRKPGPYSLLSSFSFFFFFFSFFFSFSFSFSFSFPYISLSGEDTAKVVSLIAEGVDMEGRRHKGVFGNYHG